MTSVESIGRSAVGALKGIGALTVQFWRVLSRLRPVLPVIGKKQRRQCTTHGRNHVAVHWIHSRDAARLRVTPLRRSPARG
jgi:hypothetical protein